MQAQNSATGWTYQAPTSEGSDYTPVYQQHPQQQNWQAPVFIHPQTLQYFLGAAAQQCVHEQLTPFAIRIAKLEQNQFEQVDVSIQENAKNRRQTAFYVALTVISIALVIFQVGLASLGLVGIGGLCVAAVAAYKLGQVYNQNYQLPYRYQGQS
jgi:hypothetical protein